MTSLKNPFLYHVKNLRKDDEIKMLKDIPNFIKISDEYDICGKCNQRMKKVFKPEFFPLKIDGEKTGITVNNVPMHSCENCNEEYSSLRVSLAIEELIDREVFYMLNNRERDKIPKEVDFENFTKKN